MYSLLKRLPLYPIVVIITIGCMGCSHKFFRHWETVLPLKNNREIKSLAEKIASTQQEESGGGWKKQPLNRCLIGIQHEKDYSSILQAAPSAKEKLTPRPVAAAMEKGKTIPIPPLLPPANQVDNMDSFKDSNKKNPEGQDKQVQSSLMDTLQQRRKCYYPESSDDDSDDDSDGGAVDTILSKQRVEKQTPPDDKEEVRAGINIGGGRQQQSDPKKSIPFSPADLQSVKLRKPRKPRKGGEVKSPYNPLYDVFNRALKHFGYPS